MTALSQLSGSFVIGRNTTFSLKKTDTDTRQIAEDLGVRYVLEGSVRTAGDRVRVTAQLSKGGTGRQIWGERYDHDLADIFAIQDEVTGSVVGRLAPELYAAEHARLHRRPP